MLKCRDIFNLAHGEKKKKKAKILCCFQYIWENKVKLIDTTEQNHLPVHILYAKFVKKDLQVHLQHQWRWILLSRRAPKHGWEVQPPEPGGVCTMSPGAGAFSCLLLRLPAETARSEGRRDWSVQFPTVSGCGFKTILFWAFKAFTWLFSLTIALAVVLL